MCLGSDPCIGPTSATCSGWDCLAGRMLKIWSGCWCWAGLVLDDPCIVCVGVKGDSGGSGPWCGGIGVVLLGVLGVDGGAWGGGVCVAWVG